MSKRNDLVDEEAAHAEAVREVQVVLGQSLYPCGAAQDIVDHLVYGRADLVQRLAYPPARRVWWLPRSQLDWDAVPLVMRAGDEFGNDTVAVRLLFGQLVVATTWPLRRIVEPASQPSQPSGSEGR